MHLLVPLPHLQLDTNIDLGDIARRTEGFSCADIRNLCREAVMQPLRVLLKAGPSDAFHNALTCKEVRAE